MGNSNEAGVAVLAKAVATLELLAEKGETTTAEVATHLGEPRSSVYRLLRSLGSLGLVEAGGRAGGYRLGLAVLRLGSVAHSQLEVRQVARPLIERLHDECAETVFLCVRQARRAVFVDRIDGRRAASVAVGPGQSLPLHAGAAPRALLAFSPRSDWDAYLERAELREPRTGSPLEAATIVAQLERTLATGIGVSDGDLVEGIAAIGAPIIDYRGGVRGAIAISGLRDDILGARRRFLTGRLLATAGEASRALAHRAGGGV
jgi:DNA-binding IclR family transcriptional regulator